jgi:hypothetical protein
MEFHCTRVRTAADRDAALEVVSEVWQREKGWIKDAATDIPVEIAELTTESWLLVRVDQRPAGVVRLRYDHPVEPAAGVDVQLERPVDLDRVGDCRVVEVGRFMILPQYRASPGAVLGLMRAAIEEVVTRGYTHFITTVYEDDPHSPLEFHQRVLGFERLGTLERDEAGGRRTLVILVLDLARAYARAGKNMNRIVARLTSGLTEALEALPVTPAVWES